MSLQFFLIFQWIKNIGHLNKTPSATSRLVALGYANLIPLRLRLAEQGTKRRVPQPTQKGYEKDIFCIL
jgi:hypothetical protein